MCTIGEAMPLRKHQLDLIEKLEEIIDEWLRTGFLPKQIVEDIFPGGGKSTHPIIALKMLIEAGIVEKLMWVTVRKSLKTQGAEEFLKPYLKDIFPHNFQIRETETINDEDLTRNGEAGFIITYQALASASKQNKFNNLLEVKKHKYLLFLDECQHVSDETEDPESIGFYKAIKPFYDAARFVICSSGTLFRHEKEKIAFIDYESIAGKLIPRIDIKYTKQQAENDKAVIKLLYNKCSVNDLGYKINGRQLNKTKIENSTDLGVALTSGYADELLEVGLRSWQQYRTTKNQRSKLIIIAHNQKRCKDIQEFYKTLQPSLNTCLAISDEKSSQENIQRFRQEDDQNVLITCQMAYEGLDCKQATHLIVLTNIRSTPWITQALTRIMRYDQFGIDYEKQQAYAWVPDDPEMLSIIEQLGGELDNSIPLPGEDWKDILNQLNGQPGKKIAPSIIEDRESTLGAMVQTDGNVEYSTEILDRATMLQASYGAEAMSAHAFVSMLEKMNQLHLLDLIGSMSKKSTKINSKEKTGLTIRQQEKELRNRIQRLANLLDRKFGYEYGQWNKDLFNAFRFKNRKSMSLDELNECEKWLKNEAKQRILAIKKS